MKNVAIPVLIVALVVLVGIAGGLSDDPAAEGPIVRDNRPPLLPVKSFTPGESLSPNEKLVEPPAIRIPERQAPRPGPEKSESPESAAAKESSKPARPAPPARRAEPAQSPDAPRLAQAAPSSEPRRSRIEVPAKRAHPDGRLKAEVMNAIAGMAYVSGQVGVESRNAVVTLSGWTTTAGQSLRVEKTARQVRGVRHVVNQIRPRMGPITS